MNIYEVEVQFTSKVRVNIRAESEEEAKNMVKPLYDDGYLDPSYYPDENEIEVRSVKEKTEDEADDLLDCFSADDLDENADYAVDELEDGEEEEEGFVEFTREANLN